MTLNNSVISDLKNFCGYKMQTLTPSDKPMMSFRLTA